MTREGILALPAGRELDALVAEKVMGWHRGEEGMNGGMWLNSAGEIMCWVVSPYLEGGDDFRPSTDIAAAWRVVEHFKAKGWWWEIRTGRHEGKLFCRVRLYRRLEDSSPDFKAMPVVIEMRDPDASRVPDDNLPLAICRAVLLAVEETADALS